MFPDPPQRPHKPLPGTASSPGWMPPGTTVPPGLPGPPSRRPPPRGSRAGCIGWVITVLLFLLVAGALVWVVANHNQLAQ